MSEQWQPIETAPKDNRDVKLRDASGAEVVGHYMPGGFCVEDHPPIDRGWYQWNGSFFDKVKGPTHWMTIEVGR